MLTAAAERRFARGLRNLWSRTAAGCVGRRHCFHEFVSSGRLAPRHHLRADASRGYKIRPDLPPAAPAMPAPTLPRGAQEKFSCGGTNCATPFGDPRRQLLHTRPLGDARTQISRVSEGPSLRSGTTRLLELELMLAVLAPWRPCDSWNMCCSSPPHDARNVASSNPVYIQRT